MTGCAAVRPNPSLPPEKQDALIGPEHTVLSGEGPGQNCVGSDWGIPKQDQSCHLKRGEQRTGQDNGTTNSHSRESWLAL